MAPQLSRFPEQAPVAKHAPVPTPHRVPEPPPPSSDADAGAGGGRSALLKTMRLLGWAGVVVYVGHSVLALTGVAPRVSLPGWSLSVVLAAASVQCLLRATVTPAQRPAWLILGGGLASWSGGELLLATAPRLLANQAGGLSLGDLASLAFYPAAALSVCLLLRTAVQRFSALLWLDGLAGALAVSAVVAVVAFRPVLATSGGGAAHVAADMSYPLADLFLIAVTIFALAMTGWRPGTSLGLIAGALLLVVVADGYSLWWTSTGHTSASSRLDSLWPLGAALIAQAASRPPIVAHSGPARTGVRSLVFPILFSLTALTLLLSGLVRSLNAAGYELATSALAFLVLRMVLTAVKNLQMTAASRREALTDALTGLGNRRKLMRDLEEATAAASATSPTTLMLFDLDGFKLYNDTYGHPAGDALLSRLGHALEGSVAGWGEVYRLGGDEFCVLCRQTLADPDSVIATTLSALSERGRGFSVNASFGSVQIPTEALDTTLALQMADQRLYVQKGERRRTHDSQQARDVLMQALRERHAGLPEHLGGVALLAQAMARRFGLGAEEVDQVTRAAELHDIGKMAIPETILDKPAALDDSELSLVRQHTVIGERILAAAPALRPVGELVRASHEYFDGTGYPDGLGGEEIPLGARIITVCDAYEAMTSGRPYRAAISTTEALQELRRCAGTQFDPVVVEAFCEEALSQESQGSPAGREAPVPAHAEQQPARGREIV